VPREDDAASEVPEAAIRARCEAGDWAGAATAIVERYGRELVEYLVATARSETDGGEAFSRFTEEMWRSLPGFRWEASARTWCYVLARRALARVRRDHARRPGKPIALDDAPEVARVAERARTATVSFLRTEVRDKIAALRESLDPDDQALLILRIDRGLDWRDVALALADEEIGAMSDAAVARRAAAMRKRFERIKKQLRERAAGTR
jgi:RNA polymerase sigma-70 factor (ECF subfamily)